MIGAITDPAEEYSPATAEEEEEEEIKFVSLLTTPLFRQTLQRTHSS